MPLFSGIYNRGAGFGPAIAFLYSAPAINVFVIVLALKVLGSGIGITWTICTVAFAFILGIIMSFIFREAPQAENEGAFAGGTDADPQGKALWQQGVLLVSLIVFLDLIGSSYWLAAGLLLFFLAIFLWRYFTKDELIQWMKETLTLTRILLPWFLIGVLVSTLIAAIIPGWLVAPHVGGNGLLACFVAGFVGTLMEFCSLSLVPVVKAFTVLGMGQGPSLALLLTGSAISIPGILVIRRIMGLKRTLVYATLIFVISSFTGYIFGLFQA
jgi:hypothetical protein